MSPILATRAGISAAGYGMFGGGAVATAFESIATATPNGTGTVTFSNIPQTYQHLQLRCWMYDASNGEFNIRWESTGTRAWHTLRGNGSTVAATSQATASYLIPITPAISYNSNIGTVAIIDIHDYASTSKGKTLRAFAGFDNNGGNTASIVNIGSGMSNNTSAITEITIIDSGANFASPTRIALYGIKGA